MTFLIITGLPFRHGVFLNIIDINHIVDDDVVLDLNTSGKLRIVHNATAFTVVIDNDDTEIDLQKTP